MNIVEAIQPELSSIEIELASSLPVCGTKGQSIFYYSTSPVNDESFRIDKLFYVFTLKCEEQTVTRLSPEEAIPGDLLSQICGSVVSPQVMDDEAMELEDKYYEYFEKATAVPKDMDADKMCRSILDRLVPESVLRRIYEYLRGDTEVS